MLLKGGGDDGVAVSELDDEPERERWFEFELESEFGFGSGFEDLSDFEEDRRGRVGSQVLFVTSLRTSSVVSSGVPGLG